MRIRWCKCPISGSTHLSVDWARRTSCWHSRWTMPFPWPRRKGCDEYQTSVYGLLGEYVSIYMLPMKSNEYRIRFSLIVLYRTCLAIPDRRKKIRKGLRLLKGLCSWRTMCLITLCTEFIKIFISHRSQSNLAALAACSRPSWRHWSMYFKPNINVW